ncbi:MAG: serine hydrolase, partial [Chlamydiia bacterium]|nr:serine hydrolase [Chlamydiia bacterium]
MRILSLLTLATLSLSAVPSAQFLQEFEAYAEGERKVWGVPSMAIAIVSEDKILYEKGFGARGLDDKRPVTKDTLFQIGSLTKAFTAALVAMGVEERRFEWTTPVQEVMADFQLADSWVSRQFQMQDLLAQRSGLPSYAGDNQSILGFDREQIYRHMVHLKPATSFRAEFAYQNVFFLAAARALEKSDMGGYEALLDERIFKPLGMTNSSATLKAYQENENSAEWSLRREDGTWLNLGRSYPYEEWNYTYGAAGGINSSVHDMAKWTLFQANLGTFNGKRLISEENMRMMHRPFIFAGERNNLSVYYALGWLHVENSPYPIICHDGATMGVFKALGVIPQ